MSLTESQATAIEALKTALEVCQQENIDLSEEIKVIVHHSGHQLFSETEPSFNNLRHEADQLLKTLQKIKRDSQKFESGSPLFLLDACHVVIQPHDLEIALKALQIALLKTLEKNQLTVRDLAFTLDQTIEQTQRLVQSLWREGLIDELTASPLFIIFPGLRRTAYRQREVPADLPLTLTAKGYFSLYPMLKSRESAA